MKLLRWLVCLVLLVTPAAARFPHGSAGGTPTPGAGSIPVGGGGFVTSIQISPDGLTSVAQVDVFGVYAKAAGGKWTLLETTTRMPTTSSPHGGIATVVAPSNSSIIYTWTGDGNLWRSLNGGTTFVQLTGFGNHDAGAANGSTGVFNGGNRFDGYKMAVDPNNSDVLYVGTSAGVLVSTNAGQGTGSTPTFAAAASGIGAAAAFVNGYNFAFDANGGTSGAPAQTNILYVSSGGTGVYKRTTPAGTFSAITAGGPTTYVSNMVVSPNGVLWATDSSNLFKCIGCSGVGTWTTYSVATTGVQARAVAIDPNHSASASAEHVFIAEESGALSVTSNSGTGWSGKLSFTNVATDAPWLATVLDVSKSVSLLAYNKATDVLYVGTGLGVYTTPGNTSANFNWTSETLNIESLETTNIVASPAMTNRAAGGAWDKPFFGFSSLVNDTAVEGPTSVMQIAGGWGLDWATSDGTTLVGLATWPNQGMDNRASNPSGITNGLDVSSTSSDNGQTWKGFPISADFSITMTATASAAGQHILGLSTAVPAWVGTGAFIQDLTTPTAIPNGSWIFGQSSVGGNPNQIYVVNLIAGSGVQAGDTIKIGFTGSAQNQHYPTNAGTASGAVLHFAPLVANMVHPGMLAYDISNFTTIASQTQVLDVNAATGAVTLNQNVSASVASGDVINFTDTLWSGAIAALSPTNFIVTPSDNAPFPYNTTDGGASWNPIAIAGVPRSVAATITNGVASIVVADSSNFVIGGLTTDLANCTLNSFNRSTVTGIADSTHITVSPAPTCGATTAMRPDPGWSSNHTTDIKNVVADRVTANKAYLLDYVTGYVYVSTNANSNSSTWTIANRDEAVFNGTISGATLTVNSLTSGALAVNQSLPGVVGNPIIISGSGTTWTLNGTVPSTGPVGMTSKVNLAATYGIAGGQNQVIKSVPNNAGHLVFSAASGAGKPLVRSTDGGQTWAAIPNISNVWQFGFGKAKPSGGGYPVIFAWGNVGGTFSTYQSDDIGVNWIDRGAFAVNSLDGFSDLDGDKNVYGKLYGGYNFSGWFWQQF